MKRLLVLLAICLSVNSYSQDQSIALVEDFMSNLKKKDYARAHAFFNEEIQQGFPLDALSTTWEQIGAKLGKFKKFYHNCTETIEENLVVYTTCEFKKQTIDIKCVVNSDQQISSFTMSEVYDCSKVSEYQNPPYEVADRYREEEIVFQSGKFMIPGTVTFPKNDNSGIVMPEKNKVIIFVHGSGPNNRDAEFGPNKAFRDLAIGLAMNGYPTLRYDKRTYLTDQFLPTDMLGFSIQDEVLDDIQEAIKFIQSHPDLAGKEVYLLGHSLGGMMIQRSAADNEAVKGMIFMAGPAGPFEELLPYQYEYIFGLDGEISEEDQKLIDQIKAQVHVVQNDLNESTPQSDLPMNIPASYWMSLKDHNQIELAKEFKGRILVLNGERDYQVPMTEFEKWKAALDPEKQDVEFKSFEKLNHFFFEGEGTPNPQEYDKPCNVPEYVIKHISLWMDNE